MFCRIPTRSPTTDTAASKRGERSCATWRRSGPPVPGRPRAAPAHPARPAPLPGPQPHEQLQPARSPAGSYLELVYPFSSNPCLRDQYERFHTGKIRAGLILEDLDAFAADVAARHAGQCVANKTIVTASVDQLSWLQQRAAGALSVLQDLRMAGQVCGGGGGGGGLRWLGQAA
jgi:hypothetical protein